MCGVVDKGQGSRTQRNLFNHNLPWLVPVLFELLYSVVSSILPIVKQRLHLVEDKEAPPEEEEKKAEVPVPAADPPHI